METSPFTFSRFTDNRDRGSEYMIGHRGNEGLASFLQEDFNKLDILNKRIYKLVVVTNGLP